MHIELKRPLSKLFKRQKLQDWSSIDPIFDHEIHKFRGETILREGRISSLNKEKDSIPAILNNSRTITGDLIPYTSWGSSLANMLTRQSWNSLRFPVINSHKNVCELCGIRLNSLDVHEIWSFNTPKKNEQFGIQKLEGLLAVCTECHKCFHLGRETAKGSINETLYRLQKLNNWDNDTTKHYYHTVTTRWTNHSKFNWVLDLSIVNNHQPLIINNKWMMDPKTKLLTSDNEFGPPNQTNIINCEWKFEVTP